jgi:AcrR family transcriptional regulator
MARAGGPDAVVLREATRAVGVSPNAAYRHFADRDDLVAAVAWEATRMLADRMQRGIEAVPGNKRTITWARSRLGAVGNAYLGFARDEPGLFRTAFGARGGPHGTRAHDPRGRTQSRTPLEILEATLDDLVSVGALPKARRMQAAPLAWAAVHGLASLRLAGAIADDDTEVLDAALGRFIQRGL